MEKRENALREALDQNDKEVEQWTSFVEENETAINNMNMFSKMFTVDVMVPFGKKAYFPGKIVHTNEVLVAHYQDYFSECSAHTAIEICKQRIENGKKRLADLEGEKDLFQNKLDKPYHDGVLPTENEREIIEEYDEEKERLWREQHRQRVKEAKLKEKEEREEMLRKIKTQELPDDEDLLEDELNEELNESDDGQANQTNELLNKIISGEMPLPPPKKRIAHSSSKAKQSDSSVKLDPVKVKSSHTSNEAMIKKLSARIESLKVTNNNQSEAEPALNNAGKIDEDDENDSDNSSSEIPEEIQLMEKQAQFLPQQDRFGFYQYQLQIVDQKIAQCKFTNSKELEEKLHLFKIRDHLEELIEDALPLEVDDSELNVEAEIEASEPKSEDQPKRKISFSKENQILEFRNDESVSTMLPSNLTPKEYIPVRDVIKLDEPLLSPESQVAKEPNENNISQPMVKRKTILEKVEENIKNNNLEDADLVNKIIDSSVNKTQTIFLKFKHSASLGLGQDDSAEPEIPSTPADFYKLFKKIENIDPVTETDNNFYLKESDRERAYVDVRSEFLRPKTNILEDGSKSILKNKTAVRRETHVPERGASESNLKKKANRPKKEEEEDFTSAFDKVMGDVVERTAPDPLPEGKFIDMHAPKKRESRFKQSRNT